MKRWSAAAVFLLVALFPFVAGADDDDEPMIVVEEAEPDPLPPVAPEPAAPRAPKRLVDVSYSSHTLLLDGVAVAMFVPGVAAKMDPLPGLGVLTYLLGAPIVHFSHGNVGKGIADAAIRTVAPFVFAVPGLLAAAALTSSSSARARSDALDVGGYSGLALGCAFAMAVDAFVLAKDRVPEERAYMRDDAKLRLVPNGIAGRF